jgi:uncharacterized membrane protein YoaT (DUF817 family)
MNIWFYRYDYLLIYALIIQICLLYLKLESWAEAKVIALFHIMAMVMEIFLTPCDCFMAISAACGI